MVGTAENYWNPSVTSATPLDTGIVCRGKLVWKNTVYSIDCTNKQIIAVCSQTKLYVPTVGDSYMLPGSTNSYICFFNPNMYYYYYRNTVSGSIEKRLVKLDDGKYRDVSSIEVNTVLYDNSKIVINNNLYYLNNNLSTGTLIKESVIPNFTTSMKLIQMFDTFYRDISNGRIYKFNIDTNTFEFVTSLSLCGNVAGDTNILVYTDSSNYVYTIDSIVGDKVIGYNCYGNTLYLPDVYTGSSNDILINSQYYNRYGTLIAGTMPNNGVLNYTPTISQQTIPTGYTSGGTISAVTSAIDSNIQAENIKKDVTILGVTGTLEEGGSTSIVLQDGIKFGGSSFEELPDYIANADFSQITDFSYMFDNCTHLMIIPLIDTSSAVNMQGMFSSCNLDEVPLLNTSNVTNMSYMFDTNGFIYEIPQFDTSKVTNMRGMLQGNMMLETVPVFDTSIVTDFTDMFSGCRNLSDESLNNIMQMCINATSYTGTKTLKELGLTSEYATKCQTLSNWSSFAEASWTTGY